METPLPTGGGHGTKMTDFEVASKGNRDLGWVPYELYF